MFSFVGDTVVDPFCGTATTMVAALKHGRNSIGVELDTAYCKMAASRLMNENASLFGNAKLQIEFKPQGALVDTVAVLSETVQEYHTRKRKKSRRSKTTEL
jgi:site-specific DNA-methyltransferase (adenine-specific)